MEGPLRDGCLNGLAHLELPVLDWAPARVQLARQIVEPLGIQALGRAKAVLEEEGRYRLVVERGADFGRLAAQFGQRHLIEQAVGAICRTSRRIVRIALGAHGLHVLGQVPVGAQGGGDLGALLQRQEAMGQSPSPWRR